MLGELQERILLELRYFRGVKPLFGFQESQLDSLQ